MTKGYLLGLDFAFSYEPVETAGGESVPEEVVVDVGLADLVEKLPSNAVVAQLVLGQRQVLEDLARLRRDRDQFGALGLLSPVLERLFFDLLDLLVGSAEEGVGHRGSLEVEVDAAQRVEQEEVNVGL